jgi:hypothetical protein
MAKLRLHPLIEGIHGRMGDLIFRGTANGETVVYKAPGEAAGKSQSEPDSPPHPFKEAHAYARAAMADPEMRAYYKEQARKKNRSAYAMALSGYFEVQCRLGESILEDLDFSPPGEHVRRAGLFNPLPASPTGRGVLERVPRDVQPGYW